MMVSRPGVVTEIDPIARPPRTAVTESVDTETQLGIIGLAISAATSGARSRPSGVHGNNSMENSLNRLATIRAMPIRSLGSASRPMPELATPASINSSKAAAVPVPTISTRPLASDAHCTAPTGNSPARTTTTARVRSSFAGAPAERSVADTARWRSRSVSPAEVVVVVITAAPSAFEGPSDRKVFVSTRVTASTRGVGHCTGPPQSPSKAVARRRESPTKTIRRHEQIPGHSAHFWSSTSNHLIIRRDGRRGSTG